MSQKYITVRGASEHNLKNIDIDLPRNQLVVITGLSGSGKSSLAFDTIYAEGQRRYVESLSAYARQFLEMMHKPDVESIEGLSPAISIEQKTTSKNPRSTVGTVTEIYDYMRLLWARIGVPYSPVTGKPIAAQTKQQIIDQVIALEEGSKIMIEAPIVRGRKGEYKKEIADLQRKGFQRLRLDGEIYMLDELPDIDKKKKHDLSVIVDRLVMKPDMGHRLSDSIETALDLADGLVVAEIMAPKQKTLLFSTKFSCPESGFTLGEIEPRLFSFNNPYGACPTCDGLGVKQYVDPSMVVPDHDLALLDAIAPWAGRDAIYYVQTLEALSRHYDVQMDTAWNKLPEHVQKAILYGSERGDKIEFVYDNGRNERRVVRKFEGVIPNMERRWRETDSNWVRDDIGKYMSTQPCGSCNGARLKPEALCVKIVQTTIDQITALSIEKAHDWFMSLDQKLDTQHQAIAASILKEITERLGFLLNVGLSYLTLDRLSGTLSGGESQRIRLASQIGSGLTGVLYVLDEPSIGLHQRDNDRLLKTLTRLRDLGNTVIVVEHDEDTMRASDYLVDMGPGAGIHGGTVVAAGKPAQVIKNKKSLTARYLNGIEEIVVPKKRRKQDEEKYLEISGVRTNNLKNITAKFPLNNLICVTGVSGGGKSSLVIETLHKALVKHLNKSRVIEGDYDDIQGLEWIDKIIQIDQSPIGRTPRSNPATYTGAWGPIRDWFSALPEAKARGYRPGRFSFNVKGGRCEACQGDGVIKIEMHFLPDVYVECEECKGKRYTKETLEIKGKNKNISDVLSMTIEEANEFFSAIPAISNKTKLLSEVGLDYVQLGQAATTLSGGEAQRVKLAKELSKRSTGQTVYILDEPTTGLHFEDVRKLLEVLHRLVDQGNTVIVIEHNLDVIKTADWVIDIGPEGGAHGGQIVAAGTPEDIAKSKKSFTGQYLKKML